MTDQPNEEGLSAEGREHLLRQVFELWAQPEVRRRQEAGEMPHPAHIHAVQVVLRVGEPAEVRLNEEVRGVASATANRSIAAGELVAYGDLDSIVDFSLEAADDANAGHITAIALPGGWAITFDTRYNAERIAEHRAGADEFLAAAETALERGHLRTFAEVGFAAAELLAKAELLSHPDKRLLKSKTHGFVAGLYNKHVHDGNADDRFAAALNSLGDLRAAARYLRAPLALTPARAREILGVLHEMRDHVERVSPAWPRPARTHTV